MSCCTLLIEWPVCRWDLFINNNECNNVVEDYIIDRWCEHYSVNFSDESDEQSFIQDSSKRAIVYLFLCKYSNNLNFVYPCFFIGRRKSDNKLFNVNELVTKNTNTITTTPLDIFKMLQFLNESCSFIYGNSKIYLKNGKLTNFHDSSFYLNDQYIGNIHEEKLDLFLEFYKNPMNTIETKMLQYYSILCQLRIHLNLPCNIKYEDEIILLQFLENQKKECLKTIQSKYNIFIFYDEDCELFDQLVNISVSI